MKTLINEIPVWLNYHHLYYFMVVANEGSIANAAKKLNLGQSALSIQLKQLEESIGIQLFMRSHKKLTLTENGKAALDYAKEIFKLGNELIETMHDHVIPNRIHLKIGTLDTIPKHLTLQLAKKALQTNKCTISILEGKGDELLRELTHHRIDLMLTNKQTHIPLSQGYIKKIARLPLLVFGTKEFVKLKKNFPYSLKDIPFIFPTAESQVRHEIEHYFKLLGIKPDILVESQDVMIQKLMALQGIGLIIVPEFSVSEYLKRKELFMIGKLENVFEELFMVAASRKIENPIAVELMKNFKIHGS